LDRHGVRRAAGLPTVSVILGPVGTALAAFRAWAGRRGHPVRAGVAADAAEVVDLFARCAEEARDLVADAYAYLATHTGRPVAELRAALVGATEHDLDLFFAANDARLPPGPGTQLARALCEAVRPGGAWWGRAEPLADLAGLAELTAAKGGPACLLTPPPSGDAHAWFRAAGAAAVVVATHVPRLPLAVALPYTVWSRYLAEAPDGRSKAVLREGIVELPLLGPADVEWVLARPSAGNPPMPPAVLTVLAEGVPDTFAEALAKAAVAPLAAATADEDDAARSAAERFLYEFLELMPATAGRFELNADAGFRFGPRAAEVDLLARDLRIAIEIDGYYHFRDEDGYRRDREKDWELQRRGFLVLRFLAGDIIPRLEEVRDRVLAAVALRTEGSTA
jgi:hypothetical protein